MENILSERFRKVDMPEDDMNNLLIDLWSFAMKKGAEPRRATYEYFDAIAGGIIESDIPITVTMVMK